VRQLVHRKPFEKQLARTELSLENRIFGEIMQALCGYFKRLADAYADPPTFVFGKVYTRASLCSTPEKKPR
jgi:hypothetical protein